MPRVDMGLKLRQRSVYAATILATIAMVGGFVLAVTTTSGFTQQGTNVNTNAPAGFTTASATTAAMMVATSAVAGYPGAGTQSTHTGGLAGTTTSLGACAGGSTCYQNFLSAAGTPGVPNGDFAEQITISVTQPGVGGASTAFDFQVVVHCASGCATSSPNLLVGQGYLDTGVAGSGSGTATIVVYFFLDTGVSSIAAPPTIDNIDVTFNSCAASGSCP